MSSFLQTRGSLSGGSVCAKEDHLLLTKVCLLFISGRSIRIEALSIHDGCFRLRIPPKLVLLWAFLCCGLGDFLAPEVFTLSRTFSVPTQF